MILQIDGIELSYNHKPVLRDVSFCVERGSMLGMLGVNGAGKTTLLKCMNRILQPKRGCVLLEDCDLSRMSRADIAKRIGYVPQKHGEDQLTVFDTVLLGRRPYIEWSPTQTDMDVVERVLKLMRLELLALRPVTQLSGGEAQKVVLARALAQEPDILLLDEPTSNLDLKNQLEVMTLVRRAVKEEGITAVISIHDLNLALRFADQVLLLKDGAVHTVVQSKSVTADVIKDVYDVDVYLGAVNGHPIVIPT